MALVVLVRGVNVGGHRTFRPARLAEQLKHLDVINIGAAGTFVVRNPVPHAQLRQEFASRLPFPARIMICRGRQIARLVTREWFAGHADRPDVVASSASWPGRPAPGRRRPSHCRPPAGGS
ncbi:MAG TPA: DUF1697 domain-containing protein [Fimbriiglobus sp.]